MSYVTQVVSPKQKIRSGSAESKKKFISIKWVWEQEKGTKVMQSLKRQMWEGWREDKRRGVNLEVEENGQFYSERKSKKSCRHVERCRWQIYKSKEENWAGHIMYGFRNVWFQLKLHASKPKITMWGDRQATTMSVHTVRVKKAHRLVLSGIAIADCQ